MCLSLHVYAHMPKGIRNAFLHQVALQNPENKYQDDY